MALGLPTVRGNHDRWVIEAEGEALYFSDKLAREQLGGPSAPGSPACR